MKKAGAKVDDDEDEDEVDEEEHRGSRSKPIEAISNAFRLPDRNAFDFIKRPESRVQRGGGSDKKGESGKAKL